MDISIEGLGPLFEKLDRIADIQDVLQPPMERGMYRIQRKIATYPPQPPTDYVRTGRLGRSWTTKVERTGSGVQGTVGNNVSYGPFVQSAQFQARWNRHWQTDEQVLEEQLPAIQKDFEAVIERELAR